MVTKEEQAKAMYYASLLQEHLGKIFEDDCENKIDQGDLLEGKGNLTHFFHALTNILPTFLYNQFSGKELSYLDFNHLANKLCQQYSTTLSWYSIGDDDSLPRDEFLFFRDGKGRPHLGKFVGDLIKYENKYSLPIKRARKNGWVFRMND